MRDGEKPRILISAYYFPPGGGVGALRVYKFVKYLSEFGYDPIVYTTTDRYANHAAPPGHDNSTELDAEIKRISPFGTTGKKIIDRMVGSEMVKEKLAQIFWSARASRQFIADTRPGDGDIIFYSCGPFVPLYFARIVSRFANAPYVVDLRDTWVTDSEFLDEYGGFAETSLQSLGSKLLRWVDIMLEPVVLSGSSRVITVTDRMTELYIDRYPEMKDSIETIHNGYDPNDFQTSESIAYDEYTIVYPGEFEYGRRDPSQFFTALAELNETHDVRFIHFGPIEEELVALAAEYGLSDVVDFRGYTDRDEIAKVLRSADLGLVVTTERDWELSLKVFDYVACSVPILHIGPEEEALHDFVSQFDNSISCRNNSDVIYDVLKTIVGGETNQLDTDNQVEQFTRRSLTADLVDLLEQVRTESQSTS